MESTTFTNNVTLIANRATTEWEGAEATTKDTFMEEVNTYTEFKIATYIATYWFPILVPVGVIGNTLSFVVMIQSNNRKMSTCIYMAAVSINDNIMMYVCSQVYLVGFLQISRWNPVECKLLHSLLCLVCKIVHFKFCQ